MQQVQEFELILTTEKETNEYVLLAPGGKAVALNLWLLDETEFSVLARAMIDAAALLLAALDIPDEFKEEKLEELRHRVMTRLPPIHLLLNKAADLQMRSILAQREKNDNPEIRSH